jgi:ATP-binding cassette subfamily C (CFTR/MRP) protein 1
MRRRGGESCTLVILRFGGTSADRNAYSLDEETGGIIEDIVRSWFGDWTVIAIAHKLDSILDFDKVTVLHCRRLVEFGEPRALLGRESQFRELYPCSRST